MENKKKEPTFENFWSMIESSMIKENNIFFKPLLPSFKPLIQELYSHMITLINWEKETLTANEVLSLTLPAISKQIETDDQFLVNLSTKATESMKSLHTVLEKNQILEQNIKTFTENLKQQESKHQAEITDYQKLISDLTKKNEELTETNKKLNAQIQDLQNQINTLKSKVEKFEKYEKLAILRQFAINVEYELKSMLIARMEKKEQEEFGTEESISKAELSYLEGAFGPADLSRALEPWFGKIQDFQTQYDKLKECLRWMKSLFSDGLAHPTQFDDGKPVEFSDLTEIASIIKSSKPTGVRKPFSLSAKDVYSVCIVAATKLQKIRNDNKQEDFLYK